MALFAVPSQLKALNPNLNPSPSRRHRISSSLLHLPPLLARNGRLRCSAGYGDDAAPQPTAPTTQRPDEIPWSRDLCNSVRLIGTVGTDVELRQLPSGASVARGRIAVWKSATETTWVTLAFWDDLAVVASEHVKQGDRIFVSGRLVSDTVDEGPEKRQVYYKVVVQQLNFIESFQPVRLYEPESSLDNQGGKHGDFVENDSTSGSTENKNGDYMNSSSRSTEGLWQAFFANPLDWWDNRKNKHLVARNGVNSKDSFRKERYERMIAKNDGNWEKNPRYPDFKHKSTGEALWVDGRNNPNWVISQLAILDSRMGSLQDKERKPVSYMYADDFMTSDTNT